MILGYHSLACLWTLVESDEWIPPIFWINPSLFHQYKDQYMKYLHSLYYSLMGGLASGEIGPVTTHDTLLAAIIIFIGSVLNATTFAILTDKIIDVNSKTPNVQNKINIANTIMADLTFPFQIRKKLRAYFQTTQGLLNQQEELSFFLETLSPSLRNKVLQLKFAEVVSQNMLFRKSIQVESPETDEILTQLKKYSVFQSGFLKRIKRKLFKEKTAILKLQMIARMMKPILCQPEEVIIDYGDILSGVYFISNGACSVLKRRLSCRQDKVINELGVNENFGEISMVFNSPAFAKVQSTKYTILGKLEKQQFATLNRYFPSFYEKLKSDAVHQSNQWKEKLTQILERTPYFSKLKREQLCKLIYSFKLRQFDKGSIIFYEGDLPKGLWIIVRGFVSLSYREIPLTLLSERGIINYDRFSYLKRQEVTAKAMSFITCAFLPNQKIKDLIQLNISVAKEISETRQSMQLNGVRPYPLDYFIPSKTSIVTHLVKISNKQAIIFRSFKSNASFCSIKLSKKVSEKFDYQANRRNPKFKLKNAILRIISLLRMQRKNQPLPQNIERLLKYTPHRNSFSEQVDKLQIEENQIQYSSILSFYQLNARIENSVKGIIKQLALNSTRLIQVQRSIASQLLTTSLEESDREQLASCPSFISLEYEMTTARGALYTVGNSQGSSSNTEIEKLDSIEFQSQQISSDSNRAKSVSSSFITNKFQQESRQKTIDLLK